MLGSSISAAEVGPEAAAASEKLVDLLLAWFGWFIIGSAEALPILIVREVRSMRQRKREREREREREIQTQRERERERERERRK